VATPNDRKYSKSHEWIKIDGKTGTMGLSEFAVNAIKDIVYLELPEPGRQAEQLKPFGVIESVKAVFDLYCPMAGKVSEVNTAVMSDFEALARDPYGKGWLVKLELDGSDSTHLMDAASYDKYCAEEAH
jgi:glycine cleavage system H protein